MIFNAVTLATVNGPGFKVSFDVHRFPTIKPSEMKDPLARDTDLSVAAHVKLIDPVFVLIFLSCLQFFLLKTKPLRMQSILIVSADSSIIFFFSAYR
jgi:hypothetical protein